MEKVQLFHLSTTIGKMSLPVEIADYDPNWPKLFKKEKKLILGVVGHVVVGVEHIGSTAVPGLGAKPIIDILVAVNHLSDAETCIEPLKVIGYKYQPEHEAQIPERRFFNKGKPPKEQHYHLHMVELTSDFWEGHLLFRDYLRVHPEVVQEYQKLKRQLGVEYRTNREGYTEAKTPFIESIVAKARIEKRDSEA
jgi:GrpB-like predicted nucleotidyltransferase (UPF0157 family)